MLYTGYPFSAACSIILHFRVLQETIYLNFRLRWDLCPKSLLLMAVGMMFKVVYILAFFAHFIISLVLASKGWNVVLHFFGHGREDYLLRRDGRLYSLLYRMSLIFIFCFLLFPLLCFNSCSLLLVSTHSESCKLAEVDKSSLSRWEESQAFVLVRSNQNMDSEID